MVHKRPVSQHFLLIVIPAQAGISSGYTILSVFVPWSVSHRPQEQILTDKKIPACAGMTNRVILLRRMTWAILNVYAGAPNAF